ncbi:MAG: alpha/beta fold hydrolase [Pseudomonadota bacterium]
MGRETLVMPRLGETMEVGRLVAWLKAPGEDFARGETIAEVETDKTVVELPALAAGIMAVHLVHAGDDVAVGSAIAEVDTAAGGIAAARVGQSPAASDAGDAGAAAPLPSAPLSEPAHRSQAASGERQRATPAARRLARERSVPLAGLAGTGRRGRIESGDVLAATAPSDARTFAHDGGTIVYDLFGDPAARDTLLLVHGYSGDRLSWGAFAPMLAAGQQVIAPDLPAHGDTTLEADTAETMHTTLRPLLDHLCTDLARLHVVGLSMGAIVATRLAEALVAAGARPRALSLISPAGLGRGIDYAFVRALAEGPTVGELYQLIRLLAVRPPELSAELLEASVARLAQRRLDGVAKNLAGPHGQKSDIVAALCRLKGVLPVRIAIGLRDEIIAPMDVANAPPEVAVHLFADAGHMIHWDTPDSLAAVLYG